MKLRHAYTILALSSCTALAQPNPDIFSLSLEELLSVSVASRLEERVSDAASVISIITADDIARYGARNLRDVLDRTTNAQITGSNLYPHNRVAMRGVSQTHLDTSILLLFNGKVLRDASSGGAHTDIYNYFPLSAIKKIEIIRGPGSVIYGTNAFAGVINIITHEPQIDTAKLDLSLGSFDSKKLSFSVSDKQQRLGYMVAASYQHDAGDSFDNLTDEFGNKGTYGMGKQGYQLIANAEYQDFSLSSLHSYTETQHVKSLYQFPQSTLKLTTSHIDLSHQTELQNGLSWENHITYNFHKFDSAITNIRNTKTSSEDIIVESLVKGKLSDNWSIVGGINYEKLQGKIGYTSTRRADFDTYRISGFAQASWTINPSNELTFGLQINNPEYQDSDISPRFGYIHHFSDKLSAKFLYGEAFRSPFGSNMFLNSPSLQGNPDLQPETIRTYEFQLMRVTDKNYSALTFYRSHHKDIHTRAVINDTPTYQNASHIDYWGVEFESRTSLSANVGLEINASHQQNEDEFGVKQSSYDPKNMFKLGLAYDSQQGWELNLFNRYYSAATSHQDLGLEVAAVNPEAKAYNLLTANLLIDTQQLWNWKLGSATQVSLHLDNALNSSIYFPSINRKKVNTIPHHAGRGLQLNLIIDF